MNQTTIEKEEVAPQVPAIARIDIYPRFIQVVSPTERAPRMVQAVKEDGQLVTIKCRDDIFLRVRGERNPDKDTMFHWGLRQLTRVKFRAHIDDTDTLVAVDIVPNRTFTSGVAPTLAGEARRKGFDIYWDEQLGGFDIRTEVPDRPESQRTTYAGLTERKLYSLLDELRGYDWGSKRVVTFQDHRFEKTDEDVIRCRPVKDVRYTT